MARRNEGASPQWGCDRGATKPDGLLRENPSGGGSFGRIRRWLGPYSPQWGCSVLAASVAAKIPRRRTLVVFKQVLKLPPSLKLCGQVGGQDGGTGNTERNAHPPSSRLGGQDGECLEKWPMVVKLENMKLSVAIDRDEDGVWMVECPAIPGCVSQGKTKKQAIKEY